MATPIRAQATVFYACNAGNAFGVGGIIDSIGGNNANLNSDPGVTLGVPSVSAPFQTAIDLNGLGIITRPDNGGTIFPAEPIGSSWSAAAWVKLHALGTFQDVFARRIVAGGSWQSLIHSATGQLGFNAYNGASFAFGSDWWDFSVANPWAGGLDVWHHIAVTKAATLYTIYVDGVVGAQSTGSDIAIGATQPLTFGGDGNSANALNGVIDECGHWAFALTLADVAALVAAPPSSGSPLLLF